LWQIKTIHDHSRKTQNLPGVWNTFPQQVATAAHIGKKALSPHVIAGKKDATVNAEEVSLLKHTSQRKVVVKSPRRPREYPSENPKNARKACLITPTTISPH
jgi:hypothetical protein